MIATNERCIAQRSYPLHVRLAQIARSGIALLAFVPGALAIFLCIVVNAASTMLRKATCADLLRAWYEQRTSCAHCGYRHALTGCPRCESMHRIPRLVLMPEGKGGDHLSIRQQDYFCIE